MKSRGFNTQIKIRIGRIKGLHSQCREPRPPSLMCPIVFLR